MRAIVVGVELEGEVVGIGGNGSYPAAGKGKTRSRPYRESIGVTQAVENLTRRGRPALSLAQRGVPG